MLLKFTSQEKNIKFYFYKRQEHKFNRHKQLKCMRGESIHIDGIINKTKKVYIVIQLVFSFGSEKSVNYILIIIII